MKRPWRVILLLGTMGFWLAGCDVGLKPPAYVSTSRMMLTRQTRAAETEEMTTFFGTQVELMKSAEVRKRAVARVRSLHPDLAPEEVELEVTQLPKTSIFAMRAIGKSGNYVQNFLDACMDEYIATTRELASTGTTNTAAAIMDELVRVEKEMKQLDEELHALTKVNNLVSLQEDLKATAASLAQSRGKMSELKMELDLMDSLTLEQTLELSQMAPQVMGISPKEASSESSASALEYMKARMKLFELTYQRRELKGDADPKKTSVVASEAEIARIEGLLKMYKEQWTEASKTRREGIGILADAMLGEFRKWEAKSVDVAARLAEYEKAKSRIEKTKTVHDRLLTSLRSVEVAREMPSHTVSILERATPAVLMRR